MSEHFGTFLHDRLRDKNWTLEKASQISNISATHLEHLIAGNFEALPPAPYLRGYLTKLGALLDFDGEAWWQQLKDEEMVKTSGDTDALPKNRFKEASTAPYWIGGIVIVIVVYIIVRFTAIFGTPLLTVEYPPKDITPVDTEVLTLRGTLRYGDKIFADGEEVMLRKDGSWEKQVPLHEGLNTIEIEGRRFLGGTAKTTRQVLYTVPTTSTSRVQ
jgi:hypothetical protein